MQALSDVGVESSGRHDRGDNRALAMSAATDRGLLRRTAILLGVSWDYHRAPSPAGTGLLSSLMPRRLAVALGSLAMLVSAMTPAASMAGTYDPAGDMNSLFNTTRYTGAQGYWNAGYTGAGVDVAIIDTGVNAVEGLATPGKIIHGPDLSFESQARWPPQPGHQRPRHIHGRESSPAGAVTRWQAATPATRPTSSALPPTPASFGEGRGRRWRRRRLPGDRGHRLGGSAPYRQRDEHPRAQPGIWHGQPAVVLVDPLAFAVEQAWKAGIFVVTATGNAGYAFKTGTSTNPAFDPKIFAVGSSDSMGTATQGDDIVAAFSSTGSNVRTPDVVAPGAHIVSLRVPGSYIDQNYGSTGYVSPTLFRGKRHQRGRRIRLRRSRTRHPAASWHHPRRAEAIVPRQRDRPRNFELEAGIRRG